MNSRYILLAFLFLTFWILLSMRNYREMKSSLLSYQSKYKRYKKLEEEASDIASKSKFFIKRMNLERDYPILYQSMLEYEENPELVLKQSKRLFVLIGPFYNIFS